MSAAKVAAWRISLAKTPKQIARCCSVMRELRPHIKAIDFAAQVLHQQKEGYQLAFLELDGVVRSVAGFRILNLLFSGRTLYIDDLVTHDSDRSRGFGCAPLLPEPGPGYHFASLSVEAHELNGENAEHIYFPLRSLRPSRFDLPRISS